MKLYKIENNYNYTAKCINCPSLLKFNIDEDNLIINGECKSGHIFKNISPKQLIDFIKNTYYTKYFCYKCKSKINEDLKNYICLNCNKLFCLKCINKHSEEQNHKSIIFNNNLRLCREHNLKITLYCEVCKANICEECRKLHFSHCIKQFFDIIPKNIKKKDANNKIDDYKKKIEHLLDYITKKKLEIDKRFSILIDFYNNLLYINEKLLKKFNNSIYDYYNYQNFQNFFNYQYDEICFDESKNLNYLLFGQNSNEIKDDNIINEIKTKEIDISKNIDNFNICNYNNLNYLKDNIFFLFEQKDGKNSIKFFEYKDLSFKIYFTQILGNCNKINSIKKGNYNNIFIITRENKIFVIKYDIIDKKAFMSKIYDPHHKKNFHDIIDIKNDIYIISDPKGLKIFKDLYIPENIIKNINGYFTLLNNIDDSMFLSEEKNNIYFFFNSKKYECIKSFIFPTGFKFEGKIKSNNLLIFHQNYKFFYIIDIKNLEIIQKIDYLKNDRFIKININGLYEFSFNNNIIEIKKFSFELGCFNNLVKISNIQDNTNIKAIKYINNDYILLAMEDELEIFNL